VGSEAGSGLVLSYFKGKLVVLMARPLNKTVSRITNDRHGNKYYNTRPDAGTLKRNRSLLNKINY